MTYITLWKGQPGIRPEPAGLFIHPNITIRTLNTLVDRLGFVKDYSDVIPLKKLYDVVPRKKGPEETRYPLIVPVDTRGF